MEKDNRWVVCPMCSRGRKLITRNKGEVGFKSFDPATSPCIDFRNITGGRASGFPRIGSLTIDEMRGFVEYRDMLLEIKAQAQRIVDYIGNLDKE